MEVIGAFGEWFPGGVYIPQFSGIDEVRTRQISVRPNLPNKFGTKLDKKSLKFTKLQLLSNG